MKKRGMFLLGLLLAAAMAFSAACVDEGTVTPPTGTNTTGSPTAAITVEEAVLYEAEGVRITATGYESGLLGPEIKMLIENNSDRSVLVTSPLVSVNGYMMPTAGLYAEVAAGKKSNESLTLYSSELRQADVDTVGEVAFKLKLADSESWDDIAVSDLITIATSAAPVEQTADESGNVVYDKDGIKVVCRGLRQDSIWGGTVVFYMSNNSGKPITVYAENVSVNGFMQEVGLWSDLRDGTRIVDGMALLELSELELESIDEVENIEFTLRIINSATWDDIAKTDVISLDFKGE